MKLKYLLHFAYCKLNLHPTLKIAGLARLPETPSFFGFYYSG